MVADTLVEIIVNATENSWNLHLLNLLLCNFLIHATKTAIQLVTATLFNGGLAGEV